MIARKQKRAEAQNKTIYPGCKAAWSIVTWIEVKAETYLEAIGLTAVTQQEVLGTPAVGFSLGSGHLRLIGRHLCP